MQLKKIVCSISIAIVLSMLTNYQATASHLAGYDFTYVFIDSSAGMYHYRVSLSLLQDCLNGQPTAILEDNPAYFAVYNGAGVLIRTDSVSYSAADSMPVTSTTPCAKGGINVPLCVNKKVFTLDYYLPLSASGYNITYQRCCLNPTPVNLDSPNNLGISCYISIPPSGAATHNNSAVFANYPPSIIAVNIPFTFDCSATDADGDSLSYALCTPYSGIQLDNIKPDPPAPPPFTPVPYISPFTYSGPMSGAVPLAINPVTGMMTVLPDAVGQYLITVCCSEWRHGILINTIQREFEINVANCVLSTPQLSVQAMKTLYPNPATTILTIQSNTLMLSGAEGQITITNLLGQTVYAQKYSAYQVQVDVSGLPSGIYFVKVNDTEVRKFIKQ